VRVGDDTFGLLDQDTTVQRCLQLPPDQSALRDRACVQNADRRHVRERARRDQIVVRQFPDLLSQQVEGADDLLPQPHRDSVDGTKAEVECLRAELGPLDAIYTRIGAADDLAGGRSTFMVEMTEAAYILNRATPQSLVLIDEIGRGTSTFDGLALAWAYVACRALHSLIHLTYNNVLHRLAAFAASNVVLLVIWIRLVLAVLK